MVCALFLVDWLTLDFKKTKGKISHVWLPYCWVNGWLMISDQKIKLCVHHFFGWMVDLVIMGKNFKQWCLSTHWFIHCLKIWCVRFSWLTGWLWILSRKTKLKIAWITWPKKVYALSVVDWLTLDFTKRQRQNFSCVAAILLVEWLTCDFWPKNQTVCAPFLWLNGWLSCNRKKFQTVVSFHSLTYQFCMP